MEDPLDRDETITTAKDPVKTEGIATSNSGNRSDGSSSPPPNCSICLENLINISFTDSCLHQFCFSCLLQWSKIKTECPLCKQVFKSIIHNVRSEEDYDQYHVPRELVPPLAPPSATLDVNFEFVRNAAGMGLRRFSYRTTMTPNRRYRMLLNPNVSRPDAAADLVPQLSREERRYRSQNPTGYRRNVYRYGQWSAPLAVAPGGPLEHSAEYYRRNPCELDRLIPWINRDLQILLNANEPHIAYVLRAVMDALTNYDLQSAELRDTLRPYFSIHTEQFIHELMNFARAGIEVADYDNFINYPSLGLPTGYINSVRSPMLTSSSSSSSSNDSDVRVVEEVGRLNLEIPSVGPHTLDMPGPSTVSQTFQMPVLNSIMSLRPTMPDILTISSSSSSDGECEFVGYVKPRHERTPEIIELLSSDGENAADESTIREALKLLSPESPESPEPRPSTSQEPEKRTTRASRRKSSNPQSINLLELSSTQSSSESDSDSGSNDSELKKKSFVKLSKKKTSKSRKYTSKKDITPKKITQNTKKRSRVISSSNDNGSPVENGRRRSPRKKAKTKTKKIEKDTSSDDDDKSNNKNDGTEISPVIIKLNKNFLRDAYTDDSGSNSSSTSSRSSSCSSSSSESSSENRKKRSPKKKTRKTSAGNSNTKLKGRLRTSVSSQCHVSTILRKDSNKKDEWYVDKKRLRSISDSSDSSPSDKFDSKNSMDHNDERWSDSQESPDRFKNDNKNHFSDLESDSDDDDDDDDNDELANRSNSQNSTRSEKNQPEKRKSKRRRKHRSSSREFNNKPGSSQLSSVTSGSVSTSPAKHSDGKKKKRHKSHKKHKTPKQKRSKTKKDKKHRARLSSSSTD